MAEERIQKILARAGLGSRRSCEELISAGRVMVNGKSVSLGDKADPQHDRITLDGKPVDTPEPFVYYMLYKPRNVLSTASAPDERQTVVDLVPAGERVYPVGRLDVDSEGLILLTNDGELANRLTHPRYGHEKEYRVLVARRPDPEQIETWQRGVVLEDGYRTQPADVRLESFSGKGAWLRVILREGRKRQIRETGKQIGLPVVKIIRIRIGSLQLAGLKPREWRPLSPAEVAELKGQGSKGKAGSGRAKPRSGGKAGRPPTGSKKAPKGAPKGGPKGGPKGAPRGGKGKPGNRQ
ncbi:MAG TPA: pseudouridine synthase [Anaerolineales bacterium]|nr:pseudouridine synthase [Anaerolineales bacterium]